MRQRCEEAARAHAVQGCYLRGQQRVGIEALHAADQLVLGVHHVVYKRPVNQEPVRASVHGDALWDLAVAQAPHVCVTLKEETVQTLLPDEAEEQKTSAAQIQTSQTRPVSPNDHKQDWRREPPHPPDREGEGDGGALTGRCLGHET